MKRYLAGVVFLMLAAPAGALTISPKDRAFISGAAITYILMKSSQASQEEEDPCWRGGWDDGTPCYSGERRRHRNVDFCPTMRFCNDEYHHPVERNACLAGIADCRREAEKLDWNNIDEAYLRGRGR